MPDVAAAIRAKRDERAGAVRAQHAALKRRKWLDTRARDVAVLGLGVLAAWAIYNNTRLAALVAKRPVVYAAFQGQGEIVASDHYEEVAPAGRQEQDVQNALWTYVQARECYSTAGFVRQAYIAQAMSEMRVGSQVHQQFALANPLAPQHLYGEHHLTVQCDLVDPPTPVGSDGDQYLFRFHRAEDDGRMALAEIDAAPVYDVTLRYRTGVYPADDKRRAWLDRVTFNAPGVQVLDYPGARPENARPILPQRAVFLERRP